MRALTLDDEWLALGEVNNWVRFADTKASVLLALGSVTGGVLLSRPLTVASDIMTAPGAAWAVALLTVTLSLLSSLIALRPRLRVSGLPRSLLHFGDVAQQFRRRPDNYVAAFAELADDPETIRREVARQIWANSIVARAKFRHVTVSTWLIGVGLVACGVAFYLRAS